MTRSTAILGTTDFLALIYEYEIDIVTGIREVFDEDVEPEQCFDLALSLRSVNTYANQHCGLSRAGQQPNADWSSRADIDREEIAGTKVRACASNTILSMTNGAFTRGAPRAGLCGLGRQANELPKNSRTRDKWSTCAYDQIHAGNSRLSLGRSLGLGYTMRRSPVVVQLY